MLDFLKPYLFYAKIAAAMILIAFLAYQWHAHNAAIEAKADAAGYARGHAELVEYQGKLRVETDRRLAENVARDAQTRTTNEAVIHDYQTKLLAIASDRDSLSQRLHNYQARTCTAAMPQDDHRSAATDAITQPSSPTEIDRAIDENDRACKADSAQLDALIAELKPQLAF